MNYFFYFSKIEKYFLTNVLCFFLHDENNIFDQISQQLSENSENLIPRKFTRNDFVKKCYKKYSK